MAEPWPNLYVVGAPKAGTTSLNAYLDQHPEIEMCPTKEPWFFARDWDAWRRDGRFAQKRDAYLALFEDLGDAAYRGEATPSYLWHPEAADRIAERRPDARIVVSLRDPVERAFSHYLMEHREGREDLGFVDALAADLEEETKSGDWSSCRMYVQPGMYCDQVRRYLDAFGDEQVHVMTLDDLRKDARGAVRAIVDGLGLDPDPVDEFDLGTRYGYKAPRGEWARRLRNDERVQALARAVLPYRVREFLGDEVLLRDADKPEMPAPARRRLVAIYRDEIACLEDLLDRDLAELRASWPETASPPG